MENNQLGGYGPSKSKMLMAGLLMAPMVNAVDQQLQATAEATQRLHALERVQIQVYDALEKLHQSEWKDSSLNTEQLLQQSTFSDQELNQKIIKNLKSSSKLPTKMVGLAQTQSKSTGKLKCVVGGKECLYQDRKALINGDITQFAQTQFKQNESVELPSDDFNVQINSQSSSIEEPNAIDQILNQKLQSDIEAQAIQTDQQIVNQTAVTVANSAPAAAQLPLTMPKVDEKKLEEQARAIALANIEAAQKKAELERQAKIQAEQSALLAKQQAMLAAEAKAKADAQKKAQEEAARQAKAAQLELQKRQMAERKAAAIAKAKANLAKKLAEAQEKRKKEILMEEASIKAKELAKQQAQALAQQKAAQIAQAIIEEQEHEEMKKQALIDAKKAEEAAKQKAIDDAKKAEEEKKRQAEEAIREKKEAEEKAKREQERRNNEAMEQAKQEMEEQAERDRIRKEKEDAEYAQQGDLGEMMSQLKEKTIQEQKEAAERKKVEEEQQKKEAEEKEKKKAEDAKAAKEAGENLNLSPAMDEVALTKIGEPTQEEIDNSIQLTQIGSEIKMTKKSSMYAESELEKKKHKKKKDSKKETKKESKKDSKKESKKDEKKPEAKKAESSLSDETQKLLAEATAALQSKPEILKKIETPQASEKKISEKKPEVTAEAKPEPKPEPKPEEMKPEAKPAEVEKPAEAKPEETKAEAAKAESKDASPAAPKKEEPKSIAQKEHKKKHHKKHHKKHSKKKEAKKGDKKESSSSSSSSSSSDDDDAAVAVGEQQTPQPPAKARIQVVKEECPQVVCPKCLIQPIIELSQQGGKDFSFTPETSDVLNPDNLEFRVVPSNIRDQVNSIDVIENQKILGFSTYNNLLTDGAKHDITDSDADYYNVTINLVVKRMSQFEADAKHKKYEEKILSKGGILAEQNNTDAQAGAPADDKKEDKDQKAKDATALMIEIDTKKKEDEDLAARLAGFSSMNYGQSDDQSEDPNQLLTQIVTEVEDQQFEDSLYLEMEQELRKKHRAVSADEYDEEESDVEDQNNSYVEYIPKKRDQVDEEFSRIQDEDMQNEKLLDRRQQQVLQAQKEHDAFMRRLDKKGMSAVTHEDDKTTLDVISDSLKKKEMKFQKMKVKTVKPVQQVEKQRVISEAELEANRLAESLRDHRIFENHQDLQSQSEINLDSYNQETISQIQAQIEARVQKDLEQLSIIANNKYAGGKRLYDYQLVRLSDGQQKLEKEALEKADELYFKQSMLKQREDEMNKKFKEAEQTLNDYKVKFYKDKNRLQQDHDSFVKIKQQTEKELKEQIAIQQTTENMVVETLNEKVKLYANSTKEMEAERKQQAEQEAKKKALAEQEAKRKAEQLKQEQAEAKKKADLELQIRKKIEAEMKAKQEAEEKKHQEEAAKAKKEAEEKAKKEHQARLEAIAKAKKKAEEKAAELAKAEAKAKAEAAEQERLELKAKQEAEELEKQEEMLKKKAEENLKKKKEAAEAAKKKLEEKAKAIEEATKKEEEYKFQQKVKEEARKLQLVEEQKKKKAELAQLQKKREEYEAKMKAEAIERAEQLELEKAEAEAKAAEEAQKKAEKEAQDQLEDMKKTEQEEKEAKEKEEKRKAEEKKALEVEMKKDYGKIISEQKEKTRQTVQTIDQLESQTALQVSSDTQMSALAIQKQKEQAEAKAKAEKEAIKQIADATMAGIKAGEQASKKLHADAKVQSEEATVAAVEKLQTKFENTKKQVMAIVQNFGKIRSDLQELKAEYIQEQSNLNNYLQLGETADTDAKVVDLKNRLNKKRHEIQEIVLQFQKMHNDLRSIKSDFQNDKVAKEQELVQMKGEAEETALSHLFEKQSQEVQQMLRNKSGLKSAMRKNLKAFLEEK